MFKAIFKKSILISIFSLATVVATPSVLAGSLKVALKSGQTKQTTQSLTEPVLVYCMVNLCFNNPEGGCNGGKPTYSVVEITAQQCAARGGYIVEEGTTSGGGGILR